MLNILHFFSQVALELLPSTGLLFWPLLMSLLRGLFEGVLSPLIFLLVLIFLE